MYVYYVQGNIIMCMQCQKSVPGIHLGLHYITCTEVGNNLLATTDNTWNDMITTIHQVVVIIIIILKSLP